MRVSPKYSSSASCRARSSSDFFTLFSKPEYVCTAYHFFAMTILLPLAPPPPRNAAAGPRPASRPRSVEGRSVDERAHLRPDVVEDAEDDRGHEGGDHHRDGRGAGLPERRPGHLLELARDVERRHLDLRRAPEHHGGDHRDDEAEDGAERPVLAEDGDVGPARVREDEREHLLEEHRDRERREHEEDADEPLRIDARCLVCRHRVTPSTAAAVRLVLLYWQARR